MLKMSFYPSRYSRSTRFFAALIGFALFVLIEIILQNVPEVLRYAIIPLLALFITWLMGVLSGVISVLFSFLILYLLTPEQFISALGQRGEYMVLITGCAACLLLGAFLKHAERNHKRLRMMEEQIRLAHAKVTAADQELALAQKQMRHLALINNIASVINRPIESRAILKATVECLVEATGMDEASVGLFDEEKRVVRIVAEHTVPGDKQQTGMEFPLDHNEIIIWLERERRPLYIPNAQTNPLTAQGVGKLGSVPIRAAFFLPMIISDEMIGIIECGSRTTRDSIPQEDFELAQTITNLATIRTAQAQLYEQERRRSTELALLHATLLDIASASTISTLLQTIVQRAAWLLDASEGLFYLYESEGEELRCMVSFNTQLDFVGSVLKVGEGAVGKAAELRVPVNIPNYAQWSGRIADEIDGVTPPACILSVPVIWQNRLTGVLQLTRPTPTAPFGENDMNLLLLFSNQAAIAIENARLYGEVQTLAVTDPMTGVFNRRGFFDVGQRQIERARHNHHPYAVLMLDLDHFKRVNDTYGHPAGDEVLAEIGKECRRNIRSIDVIGRYGGEEFVIVLLESSAQAAMRVAERICRSIAAHEFITQAAAVRLTVSIGVNAFPADEGPTDLYALIEQADQSLYLAKNSGRNCVKLYQDGIGSPHP